MIKQGKFLWLILALLFLTNIFVWQKTFDLTNPKLEVVFFDVGQGDAIFIETPQGHQILIDGGPNKKILEKLSEEMPFWDNSLDLVILTHPEKDHVGGLNYVLRRYKVENILWTGVLRDTKTFEYWQENLANEKANEIIAEEGQRIKAGEVQISIFYPLENLAKKEYKNSNDTSIIARLIFEKNSFLFAGDATKKTEKELLAQEFNLNSDVLKVGHHGSKTSSSGEFLENVSPKIAVISCGRNNPYGHPHEQVLRNLENLAIKVLRTDQHGDIKIISDGKSIKFYGGHPISNF